MSSKKCSISLYDPLLHFVQYYQATYSYKNPSDVIQNALNILLERVLEKSYWEAAQEADSLFEATTSDGRK